MSFVQNEADPVVDESLRTVHISMLQSIFCLSRIDSLGKFVPQNLRIVESLEF